MVRVKEDDWIVYRHHEGYSSKGLVLAVRPDDMVVVGSHEKDPEPSIVEKDKIIRKMK